LESGAEWLGSLAEVPAGVELVVTSPGWRPDAPLLVDAARRGIEVVGEPELAWWIGQAQPLPAPWLAVTGTNGKTTTVGMLEAILRAAGQDAVACGNVGYPVVTAVGEGRDVLAVELSSFQLQWSPSIVPAAGCVLNVAEDHLDWHGSMAAYAAAKARALRGPVAVCGVDDPAAAALLAAAPAQMRVGVTLAVPGPDQLGVDGGALVDRAFGGGALVDVAAVTPGGPSGLTDALAAAALARAYGVPPAAVAAGLAAFRPGGHRGAVVARVDGVTYVDDSKATNPHAAEAALTAAAGMAGSAASRTAGGTGTATAAAGTLAARAATGGPTAAAPAASTERGAVVWIAGGLLKGASVDALVAAHGPALRAVVVIGTDRAEIASAMRRHAPDVPVVEVTPGDDDAMAGIMTAAVRRAAALARPGDTVLLAPAAASMDQFTDYAARGDAFAAAAAALPGSRS
ncbi:MAG TPA: UDP-N-acetylmuramoyl-L-alanine--D-glutamate ligase, partial [Pseudonocardia sp.]|nr:UDP-N-acetylmuramoyl-L-alanine--D-glutamate ligase [Pseudonocardia sp.]